MHWGTETFCELVLGYSLSGSYSLINSSPIFNINFLVCGLHYTRTPASDTHTKQIGDLLFHELSQWPMVVERLPYHILSRISLISCLGYSFLTNNLGREFVSYALSSHPHGILKLYHLRTIHNSHIFREAFA